MEIPPSQLYSSPNGPSADDLSQTTLEDDAFVSVLGALAEMQPYALGSLFSYDYGPNAYAMNLHVPVQDSQGRILGLVSKPVPVSQDDIVDNIRRRGASRIDENGTGAAFPAIAETAAAKLLDSDPRDGLDEGYARLAQMGQVEALQLLSRRAIDLRSSYLPGISPGGKLSEVADAVWRDVDRALRDARPVLIATASEGRGMPTDGLRDKSGYIVLGTERGPQGEPLVRVHGTVPHNLDGEPPDSASPEVTVDLRSLLQAGDAVVVSGDLLPLIKVEPEPAQLGPHNI